MNRCICPKHFRGVWSDMCPIHGAKPPAPQVWQSEPAETLEQVRDRLAREQHIYEPKYGGKDHSGYNTLMKYEVNYEREEAFIAGFNAAIEYVRQGGKFG